MNREQKSATIEEIAAQIEAAEAIFAVDYRGISVPQAAELRAKLREADASFRVVKNRLTKLAAEKTGEERLAELLEGPTALAFVRGDTAMAAKAISSFNKEHDVLTFKGGFMDSLTLDADQFKAIARLPGRDVLNGQLAGVVASPLTGLVRGLGSMIQGLALQLGQIAEKGLVSGEASPPDGGPADAPVEEPPTESGAAAEAPAEEEPSQAEGHDDETAAEPAATSEEPVAEDEDAGAGDEVAEDADQDSQGDDASADDSGSEAEQSPDDDETSETDDASKEEE